jgi:arylsulfatase A-like enzyme
VAESPRHRPKLIVLLVIDQFRGEILPRLEPQMAPGGFRMLTEHGAFYTDCYYNYANLRTAPGHASLGAGAYSDAHGIPANEWWNPANNKVVSSVEDDTTRLVGGLPGIGASPHNLMADTFADQLRLASRGESRSFGVALKDRSAILPLGYSGNAAYWVDKTNGQFQTSTYYMQELPAWVARFNSSGEAEQYWDKAWKSRDGRVLRENKHATNEAGVPLGWYDVLGAAPAGIQHQLKFTRELIESEKLGQGNYPDFLAISISSTDILGHQVGPDSIEYTEMVLELDRELASFFSFLDQKIGLKNVWIALSADHGVAPMKEVAEKLRIPATQWDAAELQTKLNLAISRQLKLPVQEFVAAVVFPYFYLSAGRFEAAGVKEADAEETVGAILRKEPVIRNTYSRARLAAGDIPPTHLGIQYLHSYTPAGGWYVLAVPVPFFIPYPTGDDHYAPYSYDTHVPLVLYGLPFATGAYRSACEPIDLAPTWSSLLGITKPTHAYGRVLKEALTETAPSQH